jgi:hypothetical protein
VEEGVFIISSHLFCNLVRQPSCAFYLNQQQSRRVFLFQLRFLIASRSELMGRVLGIVHKGALVPDDQKKQDLPESASFL